MRPAVFLDRDGTLIEDVGYLDRLDRVALFPWTVDAIRALNRGGFTVVVITNQSGVGRGYFDLDTLARIHDRLAELLAEGGVRLDGVYFCPHLPEDECGCRKPRSGMIEEAVARHGFDPARGFVIGDKGVDVALGRAVGATTMMVRTGYGELALASGAVDADHVVADLAEAAAVIERIVKPT